MDQLLAQKFEENRPHMRAVAYRMLGSLGEADDAVQEAWIRLNRSDAAGIANLGAWLRTVVAHVCLDLLRSRKSRHEESFDEHLPDLVLTRDDRADPERETLIADSVGLALLIVLESLAPRERLAFVLHDSFGVPFDEIAGIAGCSEEAARQLASRARRKVRGAAPGPDADRAEQRRVVDAFVAAASGGNLEALIGVLDPDVVLRSDEIRGKLIEVHGAHNVGSRAVLFSRLAQSKRPFTAHPVLVNGLAGILALHPDGKPYSVLAFTVRNGKVAEMDVVRNPDRLARLDLAGLLD